VIHFFFLLFRFLVTFCYSTVNTTNRYKNTICYFFACDTIRFGDTFCLLKGVQHMADRRQTRIETALKRMCAVSYRTSSDDEREAAAYFKAAIERAAKEFRPVADGQKVA
jgi:hypothetical protein